MTTADNIAQMGGAPYDTQVYSNGNDTYYCQAIPGTRTTLSDKVFKVYKVTMSWGALSRIRYARGTETVDGRTKWGVQFELAATDLATVSGYTYL